MKLDPYLIYSRPELCMLKCCYDVILMACIVRSLLKRLFGHTVEEITGQVELLIKEHHDVAL